MIGGLFGGGSQPPKQSNPPAQPEQTNTGPKGQTSTGPEEAQAAPPKPAGPAEPPAQSRQVAAVPEEATATEVDPGPKGDDALRGLIAEGSVEVAPEPSPEAEEADALALAQAAVEGARRSAVIERVTAEAPQVAPIEGAPPAEPGAPYGEGSPYEAATSAEPGAARGGGTGLDRTA